MKIIFFGSSRYAVPVAEMLHTFYSLALVITTEQGNQEAIPFYCKAKKIDCVKIIKSADLISSYKIGGSGASLGVVADFGLIIPPGVIDFFKFGIINIHPSLLPKYRGPSPVQSAILNGDSKTGVTIMQLDKYMDHGPILIQEEEGIAPNDTSKSLYERLFKIGAVLLQKTIQKLETENLTPKEQDHENATFTKQLKRDDGFVDFKTVSSKEFFDRLIRAYYPWPGVWTRLRLSYDGQAKVIKFLPGKKIQVEGGREMLYKDFINGYPNAGKNLIEFLKKDI
ncbi:MAG: methionyl-tRNA formyltransferase [Patescibacteria group bacterium]